MRRNTCGSLVPAIAAVFVLGCDSNRPAGPHFGSDSPLMAKGGPSGGPTEFATLSKLPAPKGGQHGEAYAVNQVGSVVVGYSWDAGGRMQPVTWRMQSGKWTIAALPFAVTATGATARAVNDQGDVAGNDWPASTPHAVLWPSAGGFSVIGCGDLGQGYAITAGGQIVAGVDRSVSPAQAAVWQPGRCRENLPPLVPGGGSNAVAINGDGSVVAGSSGGYPVRWRRVHDVWQVEALDSRPGSVHGTNPAGDLVGSVQAPCTTHPTCQVGIVWYAAGGSRVLGTLGGANTTPRAINAAGEVVGLSSTSDNAGYPFIWSETLGMRRLPVTSGAWAFGVSGVGPDGTRLVVGAGGKPFAALVWVVRNP